MTYFNQVNRGGLTIPSEICFLACIQAWSLYQTLSSSPNLKNLLYTSNVSSRRIFEVVLLKYLDTSEETQVLFQNRCCENGHSFSTFLASFAQKMFNLFSKNFVTVLNSEIHSNKRQNSNDSKRNPSKHKIAKLQSSLQI
jgi:hypothetical protein